MLFVKNGLFRLFLTYKYLAYIRVVREKAYAFAVVDKLVAFGVCGLFKQIGDHEFGRCAIGDETVGGVPYADIVETVRNYIQSVGGFEKFAEWGLV